MRNTGGRVRSVFLNHWNFKHYGDNSYSAADKMVEWWKEPLQPGIWQIDDVVLPDE